MSNKRKMKKIELETLEKSEKKGWKKKITIISIISVVLVAISAASWGTYKLFENETVESKFVINNMTCGGCIGKVKRACAIPGVVEADVNLFTQTAFIKYKEKEMNPATIIAAIKKAGFPNILEGTVDKNNKGIDEPVIASVNGKPVFEKDLKVSLWTANGKTSQKTPEAFFDLIAGHVFLDAAVEQRFFTHPYYVYQDAEKLRKERQITQQQFQDNRAHEYGSFEKYLQIAGCKRSAWKVADYILKNTNDKDAKKAALSKWLAERFQKLNVEIHDDTLKKTLVTSTGASSWERVWPQIISRNTDLYNAIIR